MNDSTLRRLTIVSYGLGSVAPTVANEFCGAFLLLFFTELIHLDPIWVGYALFARMLVDALVDPAIGYLSDRTRLSSGRRRPYFLMGSLPGLACFVFVFFPLSNSATSQFSYLSILASLMALFFSVTAFPHLAMSFELSEHKDDRTRLVGYRGFLESLASLLALLSGPLLLGLSGHVILGHVFSRADCYRLAAVILAMICVVTTVVSYCGTKERQVTSEKLRYGFWGGVVDAFRNRPFRFLLLIYVFLVIANRVALAQLFLLLEHFHGKHEEQTIPLLLSFYLGSLVSMPVWIFLGTTWGRARTLIAAMSLWPLTYVFLTMAHWNDLLLCADSFLMGASFSGALAMLGAIAPEVLDLDRSATGLRREGLYASVINLVLQLGLGVGYLGAGLVLQLIGFRGGITPSANVVIGLRCSVAGFPLLFGILALLAFERFQRSTNGQKIVQPAIE